MGVGVGGMYDVCEAGCGVKWRGLKAEAGVVDTFVWAERSGAYWVGWGFGWGVISKLESAGLAMIGEVFLVFLAFLVEVGT